MRKTIIALTICLSIVMVSRIAMGGAVMAPWYNEGSGWTTYMILTSDPNGGIQEITITFYSSTGSALKSTTVSIEDAAASGNNADGPWVHAVSEFIPIVDSTISHGSLMFQDAQGQGAQTTADQGLDDVNILVAVLNDSNSNGFVIPIYAEAQAIKLGKYTVLGNT